MIGWALSRAPVKIEVPVLVTCAKHHRRCHISVDMDGKSPQLGRHPNVNAMTPNTVIQQFLSGLDEEVPCGVKVIEPLRASGKEIEQGFAHLGEIHTSKMPKRVVQAVSVTRHGHENETAIPDRDTTTLGRPWVRGFPNSFNWETPDPRSR